MKTSFERSRYERPSADVCTYGTASTLLQLSGGEPDGLSVIDPYDDDSFNY